MGLALGQIDNRIINTKVNDRLEFIQLLGREKIHVLDCCAGDGYLWRSVSGLFGGEVERLAFDLKAGKGRYRLDSRRFLSTGNLSRFDVIDIDTYGSPYEHLFAAFGNPTLADTVVVFFTDILVRIGGGSIQKKALEMVGLSFPGATLPKCFTAEIVRYTRSYVLKYPQRIGYRIERCRLTTRGGSADALYGSMLIKKMGEYGKNDNCLDGSHVQPLDGLSPR
jgi:hypothetical protein